MHRVVIRGLIIIGAIAGAVLGQATTPSPASDETPPPTYECEIDNIGDGYCDDTKNNNEFCDYDGGDCCECTCESAAYDCLQLNCRDPDAECFGGTPSPVLETPSPALETPSPLVATEDDAGSLSVPTATLAGLVLAAAAALALPRTPVL